MRILGLDIGTWSVKATELESRFRRLEVVGFHEVRVPSSRTPTKEDWQAAISRVLASASPKVEKIVAGMPPHQVTLRFLTLPVKQRKKVEQMYRFELEDTVPFKLEDSVVEHYVSKDPQGSFVLAGMVQRRFVQAQIDALKELGIDPDWLVFDGMGTINCWLSKLGEPKPAVAPASDSDDPEATGSIEIGPIALLDVGHRKTSISVWENERLVFFRTLGWGGAQITDALVSELSLDFEEAERRKHQTLSMDRKREELDDDARADFDAAASAFPSLIADISHCLVAYRSANERSVVRAMITGGTAKLRGVDRFLQNRIGIPVERFYPLPSLPRRGDVAPDDELRFGEATGRALVFQRSAGILFNFRKQGLGKETSLAEVTEFLKNPAIVRILKLTGIFALILLIHVNIASFIAGSEEAKAKKELGTAIEGVFKDLPAPQKKGLTNNPKQLKTFLQKKEKDVDGKLKALEAPRRAVLPSVLAVSAAFPDTVKVDVNVLELEAGKLRVEGVLYRGELEAVTQSLNKISSLKNVQLKKEGQRFTIEAEWSG